MIHRKDFWWRYFFVFPCELAKVSAEHLIVIITRLSISMEDVILPYQARQVQEVIFEAPQRSVKINI